MKVILSPESRNDLKDIEGYLVRRNAMAAVKVVDTILTNIEILSDHPLIGREYQGEIRRLNVTRYPYAVFYRVSQTRKLVEIVTIQHGRQEPPTFD